MQEPEGTEASRETVSFYFIFSVLLVFCLYIVVSDLVFLMGFVWVCVCVSLFSFISSIQRSSCLPAPKREGVHHRTWPQSVLCLPVCSLSIQRKGVELGMGNHDENILYEKFFQLKQNPKLQSANTSWKRLSSTLLTNEGTRQRRMSPKSRKELNHGGLAEPRQFPLEQILLLTELEGDVRGKLLVVSSKLGTAEREASKTQSTRH